MHFKTIIWRTGQATRQVGGEATGEATGEVQRVVIVMNGEMKRAEIQHALQLKHDDFFRDSFTSFTGRSCRKCSTLFSAI